MPCLQPHRVEECPARGQRCYECGGVGHFAAPCRGERRVIKNQRAIKTWSPPQPGKGAALLEARHRGEKKENSEGWSSREHILFLAGCDTGGGGEGTRLVRRIKVGPCWVNAIVDPGATINVVGEKRLEKVEPWVDVEHSDTQVYPYGVKDPLPTVGKAVIEMQWGEQRHQVEFQVIRGQSNTIIGYTTAIVF